MSTTDTSTQASASPQVTEVLSPHDLKVLRDNFNEEQMVAGGIAAVVGPYAPAGLWAKALVEGFLGKNPLLPPDRRELVIIGVATSKGLPALFQAIHIYWGLMEGLSANEIAATMLLSGEYSGIDRYTASIGMMMVTVTTLKKCVAEGTVGTNQIVGRLRGAFAPV